MLGNSLVRLTTTAVTTDRDGDTATNSATIDLGGNIRFADDGPSVTVSAAADAGVTVVTQDQDTIGANTDTATASFAALFTATPSYGADGPGTTTTSYALSLIAASGTDTGLDSNGSTIRLFNVSGVIYGSTTTNPANAVANAVFSISVNASGVVTLTQFAEIDHTTADPTPGGSPFTDHLAQLANNLVRLTATALTTDGDGDTATNTATIDLGGNIRFADDGPTVTIAASADVAVTVVTQDADTIGANTDTATASFAALFAATPSYGADGPGTTTTSYGLSLIAAAGADSGFDSNGAQINLFNVSGVIYGSTTTNPANAVANAVFSISVNSSGVVTLRQFAEIDHTTVDPTPGGSPFTDHLAVLGNNLVRLTATALTTDGDGDTATGTATIDLGGNIQFADDGPTVTVAASADAAVTVVTQDEDTIGANTDTATANFGALFTVTPAYGADGAGTTTTSYALSLIAASGADSGLDSNGVQINLFSSGGVIYGSTTSNPANAIANAVFSISVNASGVVTLTQFAEIDHTTADPTPGGSPFTDHLAQLGNNLVRLTATALTTDGDGDTATNSATIDLGGNIRFADDGPSVTVSAAADAGVTVVTQDQDTIGANTDTATASFAALFTATPSYGADGPGTTTTSYALSLIAASGTDTGLDSNGATIRLFNVSGVIYGSTTTNPA